MKRALVMAGACAFLACPALAQNPPPQNPPANPAPSQQAAPANTPANPSPAPTQRAAPSPSAMQTAPPAADFVKQAAIAGMFEIQSSELALRKHARPDRRFAEDMIRDHSRADAQLKRLVRADHINAQVPTRLDDAHQKMLDQLRGESGTQFDKDYDQMQKQGHQEAVSLFQAYSQNGDNAALKKWAARTLPTLQHHLSMADKLSS